MSVFLGMFLDKRHRFPGPFLVVSFYLSNLLLVRCHRLKYPFWPGGWLTCPVHPSDLKVGVLRVIGTTPLQSLPVHVPVLKVESVVHCSVETS